MEAAPGPATAKGLQATFRVAGKLAAPPPREKPTALLRVLTVRNVEVNRLVEIDIVGQKFHAELVVQFAFVGGGLDPHLVSPSDAFPLDGWGRPTFRPSAAWYMAQVDFNNALNFKTLDAKVVREGNDLLMNLRFEATFAQTMELRDFPCDVQALTMSMAFVCASPLLSSPLLSISSRHRPQFLLNAA